MKLVAEGGITRFLAMFYCQDAKPIGPVRSARIYFLKLLQGYGNSPLYAHVGGATHLAQQMHWVRFEILVGMDTTI